MVMKDVMVVMVVVVVIVVVVVVVVVVMVVSCRPAYRQAGLEVPKSKSLSVK
jgi:heme/copper-type cytochrome/quinol oxidase subunit 2